MAQRAVRIAVKQILAMAGVARGLSRSLHFLTANVGDNLPNLLIGHSDALPVGPVGQHRSPRNAVADDLKHLCIGVRMLLLRPRQIRSPRSAVRAPPLTQRARAAWR